MKKENYHLKNWKEQLGEDWEYLRQDNGTANIESIIEKLFQDMKEITCNLCGKPINIDRDDSNKLDTICRDCADRKEDGIDLLGV